jgi:hypothetical protein
MTFIGELKSAYLNLANASPKRQAINSENGPSPLKTSSAFFYKKDSASNTNQVFTKFIDKVKKRDSM